MPYEVRKPNKQPKNTNTTTPRKPKKKKKVVVNEHL